ncbi:MAG TPA: aminotransferase class V-fold PLP-dependent enzyme [Candidatus Dojkabacteria bacterium]|nr:aminotransferase class V-fold PLP-dependent enzyme [Candidatus Dojkabacteria bacterium]
MKLFTPGPVGVNNEVLSTSKLFFHRSKDFSDIFSKLQKNLSYVFDTDDRYSNLILTGSGTMANESVVTSVLKGRRVLFLSNGLFGERLIEMAIIHHVEHEVFNANWGDIFDLKALEEKLDEFKPEYIIVVLLETSVGVVNNVKAINNLAKQYDCRIFVDAVSGLVAEELSMKELGIDVCTSVPNKAIEGIPGLSFVSIKKEIVENLIEKNSYYLDLKRYYDISIKQQTPTTPAITLFFNTNAALEQLKSETMQTRRNRYHKNSDLVRSLANSMGWEIFKPQDQQLAIAISSLIVPESVDINQLKKNLYESDIVVWSHDYQKEDKRLNRLLQISVMGDISGNDIRNLFKQINDFSNA